MILNILKYIILILLLCNIPGYLYVFSSPGLATVMSYISSFLLIVFFLFSKPWHKPAFPFILFGLLFFSLSALNYTEIDTSNYFIKEALRFMIVVVCINEVLYRTTYKDLFFVILFGASSVIINGLIFPETNILYHLVKGRFGGFYLNPNYAASLCLIGFALSFTISSKFWRILGLIVFTLSGILTLSRTFIVVWIIINIIAIYKNKKNIAVPILGAIVLLLVINFTDKSAFASNRFEALQSLFVDGMVKNDIKSDSRDQTWALYYDLISEKPFLGHGFMKFQKHTAELPGVHNTYLMIIGEAGIIPFLIFIGLYGFLIVKSFKYFDIKPVLFYIMAIISISLLVGHGYFFNFPSVILSLFVYIELSKLDSNLIGQDAI